MARDAVSGRALVRLGPADHHALAEHEVLLLLGTDADRGLPAAEAAARLQRCGPNELPEAATGGWWSRLLGQFTNPLVIVLLVAGVVTVALGEYVDAAVIFGVVAVNALVGYLQESRAEAELDALRRMVRTTARVLRDGRLLTIDSTQLVPGDVVRVEAGDKLPADMRLLAASELQTDESALTGESLPVAKDETALPVDTLVADRLNMLYSGTLVVTGAGTGLVVATGSETELGRIHRLLGAVDPLATPLTRKLARFSGVLTVVILGLAAVTFAVGVVRGEPWPSMFNAAVALAVGAIPEGLPAAVSITLAIGVARMARRRAVIRRLPAVETLGSTTVICTDKTGTLTQNRMTVRTLWTVTDTYLLPQSDRSSDHARGWTLRIGALCCDAVATREPDGTWTTHGDPTETALVVAAEDAGIDVAALRRRYPRQDVLPFSSERQYMATSHADGDGDGDLIILVKGATERVLARCTRQLRADGATEPVDPDRVRTAADALAARGLRVLATAMRRPAPDDDLDPTDLEHLTFAGLVAMDDPPRPAAIAAVASCRRAGVAVRLITGDHARTAAAIAAEVGVTDSRDAPVLTGADLAAIPPADLAAAVEETRVFARVSPEQKLGLVDALQSRGHVVAMTGDGVNDAPALRQADIGVAMGLGGTEVAKDAADMVLTDDDFATIEAAVEEGRGVFDNLTKFIVWTLPTNMGEGLVILVAILLGTALPILPVQILWINMTTAVALGLMLAFEPKEPGIMTRPPRDPSTPLLTRALVIRILLVSAVLVAGAWWLFEWELTSGAPVEVARTAAVNLFVAVEMVYLFLCRTLTGPVRAVGWLSNRWILVGVGVQVAGQLALTYLPVMNVAFDTAPIPWEAWARIAAVAALSWVVVAVDKRLRGRAVAAAPTSRFS